MKCAYKAVLNQQRAERDERLLTIQEHRARADLFAIALFVAKDTFQLDTEQLKKMMDGMFEEAGDAFDHYKDESEKDYDPSTVPFLMQGFVNQLNALEVNVREIEDKWNFNPPTAEQQRFWSKERKNKLTGRLEILLDRELSYRAYLYAFMLYLYHEYGYEGEKLTEYYDAVRSLYYIMWNRYLECNAEQDRWLAIDIDKEIYRIEKLGINITGMTNLENNSINKETEKGDMTNG